MWNVYEIAKQKDISCCVEWPRNSHTLSPTLQLSNSRSKTVLTFKLIFSLYVKDLVVGVVLFGVTTINQ